MCGGACSPRTVMRTRCHRWKTSSGSRGGDERRCTYEKRRRAEASRRGVAQHRRGEASRARVGVRRGRIATLEANAHAAELDRWLAAGYAGTMTYLHRQAEKRKDPARIMPDAKVAIVTLTNYFHGPDHPGLAPGVSPAPGKVAQYAWSSD